MEGAFPGMGTAINVATVVVGALLGMVVGHRIPERTRDIVTDGLGLVTLLMAGLSVMAVTDAALTAALPSGSAVLVVLGSLIIGSIIGSLLGVEQAMGGLAGRLQRLVARPAPPAPRAGAADMEAADVEAADAEAGTEAVVEAGSLGHAPVSARERFIEGWLTTSLLFCVGPLTFLGSLSDGMGTGIDMLALKAVLDGFAAIAFAASFGVGVLFSAVSVLVVQGLFTLAGVFLGQVLPDYQVSSLTAVGGLLLVGIGFRLLRLREIPVGDMLPALVVAPILTGLVALLA